MPAKSATGTGGPGAGPSGGSAKTGGGGDGIVVCATADANTAVHAKLGQQVAAAIMKYKD